MIVWEGRDYADVLPDLLHTSENAISLSIKFSEGLVICLLKAISVCDISDYSTAPNCQLAANIMYLYFCFEHYRNTLHVWLRVYKKRGNKRAWTVDEQATSLSLPMFLQ